MKYAKNIKEIIRRSRIQNDLRWEEREVEKFSTD